MNLQPASQKRIGLFGGTFDPPHRAHRELLIAIQKAFQFDHICIIPSHYPPGKTAEAPYSKRLEWTREVFKDLAWAEVSDIEASAQTTIFARDLFYQISLKQSGSHYSWILGEDQWNSLSYWREISQYAADLDWIVMTRSHQTRSHARGLLSRRLSNTTCRYFWSVGADLGEISSSRIRERLSQSTSHSDLSPELEWICEPLRSDVLQTYRSIDTERRNKTE